MADFINVTKKIFFDRQRVINAMEKKTARVLSSTGAFGRTVMKNGMRRRKAVSAPGAFPSSHLGQLRDFIYFGYGGKGSVVIGPTLLHRQGAGLDREYIQGGKPVPQLINEGGVVIRQRAVGRGRTFRRYGPQEKLTFRARPFVALTAQVTIPKLRENMEKFDLK